MALTLLAGSALATGGLFERLWSYNRENFMWDQQNKQNRVFQVQNIDVNRYGLFREDVRDLAGLTTNKMDSYLIVNTLKLGFIVAVFFNFDRTDPGMTSQVVWEEIVILLFSVCFLTALALLLISIWFSMHATVIANAYMTKMLVSTVRIPLPTSDQITQAVPEARIFEKSFDQAFRMPNVSEFLGRKPQQTPAQALSDGRLSQSRVAAIPEGGLGVSRASGSSFGRTNSFPVGRTNSFPVSLDGSMWSRPSEIPRTRSEASESSFRWGVSTVPEHFEVSNEDGLRQERRGSQGGRLAGAARAAAAAAATVGALHAGGAAAAAMGVSAAVASGTATGGPSDDDDHENEACMVPQGTNSATGLPHLKFYRQLMANWQPFDLYSRICMSIGTSTMLSGFAYFTMYYCRVLTEAKGDIELPQGGSWYTFIFMSVLAWWSVLLDMMLEPIEHVVLALAATGGPVCLLVAYCFPSTWKYTMPLSFIFQAVWICLLLCSALGRWPRRWRATLFLDVLGDDKDENTGTLFSRTSSNAGTYGGSQPNTGQVTLDYIARQATVQLLKYLDAVLEPGHYCCEQCGPVVLDDSEMAEVRREREFLRAAADLAGILDDMGVNHSDTCLTSHGFWLLAAHGSSEMPQCRWFDLGMANLDRSGGSSMVVSCPTHGNAAVCNGTPLPGPESQEQVLTLADLLDAARRSTERLHSPKECWTAEDKDGLTAYGGQAWDSPWEFENQFRAPGARANSRKGESARRFFRYSALLICTAWISAAATSVVKVLMTPPESLPVSVTGLRIDLQDAYALDHFGFELPRPWFVPSALSCNADGNRFSVADGSRAFVQNNASHWSEPLSACNGSDATSALFSPRGDVIVVGPADRTGIHSGCDEEPLHGDSSPLDAVALDAMPRDNAGVHGLAARDGHLLVLEAAANHGRIYWRIAGTLPGPPSPRGRSKGSQQQSRWVSLALRAGRGLALREGGEVFEIDVSTGVWSGPWYLGQETSWRGLCALPDGRSWLTLGVSVQGGAAELWSFARPDALSVPWITA